MYALFESAETLSKRVAATHTHIVFVIRELRPLYPPPLALQRGLLGLQLLVLSLGGEVERLFSQVGIAFAAKRKSAEAATLEDMMFARINLP